MFGIVSTECAIPLVFLLDDLMPGQDRPAQVRRWNQLTDQLFTPAAAEAHVFHGQHAVSMARMKWRHGLMREENAAFHAQVAASIATPHPFPPTTMPEPDAGVSLRSLLPELFSGKRDWARWLKNYNRTMDTAHADSHGSISADEAQRARLVIPVAKQTARRVGAEAGGKAGLKSPAAREQQKPGMRG